MTNTALRILAEENRLRIINMIYKARAGHPGGSLSVIDLLTAIYETDVDLSAPHRSRVVLSKGHAVPAQYAVLSAKGIIPEGELSTFRQINSRLQGHPHILDIPETDATTGLLGQGVSYAVGMALAKRADRDPHRVYVLVGDGELHEGQIWEGMLTAAHYRLSNLVLIVDYNKLSSSGPVNEVISLPPLKEKLLSFGFDTQELDGHDMDAVTAALDHARTGTERPHALLANTVKGKGVSFMEDNPKWHSGALSDEEYAAATAEITARREALLDGE